MLSHAVLCSRKQEEAQQDMEQALQMLSELRRTESTPNVEAEALKRNKGGGGPWMSFTRQRRPPKLNSGKKGAGSPTGPRRGSPLATVVSVDAEASRTTARLAASGAAPTAPGDQAGAAERPASKK